MTLILAGKKIAVLVADGFEQIDLEQPENALREAGARTEIVSPHLISVVAWDDGNFGALRHVDTQLMATTPEHYDALLLPGGAMNLKALCRNPAAVMFARKFLTTGKPVGAVGHAPLLLVAAGVVNGRRLTSHPSLKTELCNAGAKWCDEPVVIDRGLATSRCAEDLSHFSLKLVDEVSVRLQRDRRTAASASPATVLRYGQRVASALTRARAKARKALCP